jgi:hypothetical protein
MYRVGRGRGSFIENKHSSDVESPPPSPPPVLYFSLKVSLAGTSELGSSALSSMTLLCGVTRSKEMSMIWTRKGAENGHTETCLDLAAWVYQDRPYAREVGHVAEAGGVASSAGVMEGHDVPPDVMTDVVHWLRKAGHPDLTGRLGEFRRIEVEGANYCCNEGCEVVGYRKDFKVCPQCKTARYCGDACQKQDWTTGGHKATCRTFTGK